MKKKYIEPKMDIVCTHVMCQPTTQSGEAEGTSALVKERDDEEYESESGNYGDLW